MAQRDAMWRGCHNRTSARPRARRRERAGTSSVPVPVSLRGPPFCRCHAVCVTVTIVPVPTRFARHVLSCIRRSPIAHSFIHEYRYLMREAINHHHQRVPDDRGTEGGHRPIVHRRQSNMINISGSSLPWREPGRTQLKPKRRLELSQTGHTSVHCDRGSCALGAGESALRALCCVVLNSSILARREEERP